MLRRSVVVGLMVVFVAVGLLAMVRQATAEEPAPAAGRTPRGGGAAGARPARADRATQAADRMKTSLGVSEEEWTALQPLIEKVQTLRRQLQGGMAGGMGGRVRGGGAAPAAGATAPAAAEQSETEKKAAELSKLLENKEASAEDVKTALTALREARAKVQTELDAAETALRGVLTVIQEAKLVSMGMLR